MGKISKRVGASVRQFASPRTLADVLRERGKLGPYGGASVETFGEHTAQGVAAVERLIREAATADQLEIVWRGPAEQRDRYAAAVEARRAELATGAELNLPPAEPTQAQVRAWAVGQGIDVSPRGKVAAELVDRYKAAHHPQPPAEARQE
jgi:hypothetical protein